MTSDNPNTGATKPGKTRPGETKHWARISESGTVTGIRFLFATNRILGRRVFRFILAFVSVYFVCTRVAQRRASRDYLRTHARYFPSDWSGQPGIRHTLYHFFQFGEAILDKTLAWSQAINESDFIIADKRGVRDILDDNRGQLIIGTHFGNLEYCRGFMQNNKNKTINILIYDRHSAKFVQAMEQLNPDSRLNIFQVDDLDIKMILQLKDKVENGEWLFIAGDRLPVRGVHRTIAVSFLGRQARFPEGPYQLARTLGCPVKLMFAYRKKDKVVFDLVPFVDKLSIIDNNRAETLSHYAHKFAFELEKRCKEAPFQWFNFYPFWALPDAAGVPGNPAAGKKSGNTMRAAEKQANTRGNMSDTTGDAKQATRS